MNFADCDPALRPLLDRYLQAADRERVEPVLTELGKVAAEDVDRHARLAEVNPPRLRQYSPSGDRVDEVEFHPSYEKMVELGFCRFGLAALTNRAGVLGWETPAPQVVKYALSYLFTQAEYGLGCPINMTDSAARVLRMFDPERFAAEIEALTSTEPGRLATGAMFMTEIDAGTDLAQTATTAIRQGQHWTLSGRKWFCSNVSADIILTLARVPGQNEGTRGLGMFLVPRFRPDGSRNCYRIDRLKDKLGTRSMASGEVTLDGTYALAVGDIGQGVKQMLEMVNHSRLSNIMRSTALMRRSLNEALAHTRRRIVFGKPLFEQPLMRRTLLSLILDAEASLGLVFEIGSQLDAGDKGDPLASTLARVLTPMGKYTVCKRARWVTAEALEARGGNGYIEDWVSPRLVRDAHLGSIWEGSSNVMALDVLRCMRKDMSHRVVADAYRARLEALSPGFSSPAVETLLTRWAGLAKRGDYILTLAKDGQEIRAGDFTDALCHATAATLLLEQAAHEADRGYGDRKRLVAASFLERLEQPDAIPAAALAQMEAIVDGTPLELSNAALA
jgi:acyl-CoA dehydrogenase